MMKKFNNLRERFINKLHTLEQIAKVQALKVEEAKNTCHKCRVLAEAEIKKGCSPERKRELRTRSEKAHFNLTKEFEKKTILIGRMQQCIEFANEEEMTAFENDALSMLEANLPDMEIFTAVEQIAKAIENV